MATVTLPMTTDEFLALPDNDKVERWLVEGKLRERRMSRRSPQHARAVGLVSARLIGWEFTQSQPRPKVFVGDIYCRLRRNPDTNVGIDIAVAKSEQVAALEPDAQLIEGPPLLAVEVLSPSDRVKAFKSKARQYLKNGTSVVWIVDPYDRTVTVYRPGDRPVLYNDVQALDGDPELLGFRVSVAELFD